MKIQIIHDEPEWIKFATHTLESAGHKITDHEPELVLIEYRCIAKAPLDKKFVVLNSTLSIQVSREAFRAGALDCVSMPMGRVRLLDLVENVESILDLEV